MEVSDVLLEQTDRLLLLAEKGDYLALDLGGTNFRVLHVRVVEEEQKVVKMDSQICAIPQEMMLGTGEQVRRARHGHAPPAVNVRQTRPQLSIKRRHAPPAVNQRQTCLPSLNKVT